MVPFDFTPILHRVTEGKQGKLAALLAMTVFNRFLDSLDRARDRCARGGEKQGQFSNGGTVPVFEPPR